MNLATRLAVLFVLGCQTLSCGARRPSEAASPSTEPTAVPAPEAPAPPAPVAAAPEAPAPRAPVVLLYASPWCEVCKQAKAHIDERKVPYTYRSIAEELVVAELDEKLARVHAHPGTTPTIDIDGELMVGWNPYDFDARYEAAQKKLAAPAR